MGENPGQATPSSDAGFNPHTQYTHRDHTHTHTHAHTYVTHDSQRKLAWKNYGFVFERI